MYHTPGPWELSQTPMHYIIGQGLAVDGIARYIAMTPGLGSPAEANAQLIAAAPDLMAACMAMIAWDKAETESPKTISFSERSAMCGHAFDLARAGVAKASFPF